MSQRAAVKNVKKVNGVSFHNDPVSSNDYFRYTPDFWQENEFFRPSQPLQEFGKKMENVQLFGVKRVLFPRILGGPFKNIRVLNQRKNLELELIFSTPSFFFSTEKKSASPKIFRDFYQKTQSELLRSLCEQGVQMAIAWLLF